MLGRMTPRFDRIVLNEAAAPVAPAPRAPFLGLATLWVQITGTWCNLECRHCINASGPRTPWLKPLDGETIRRAIREAEALGVKEIYFTGGEPFLHREILPLLERALEAAPTTVLTNGTLIGPEQADALAALAAPVRGRARGGGGRRLRVPDPGRPSGRAALRRQPRRVPPIRAPLSPRVRDLSPDGDDVPEQLGEYRRIAVLGGVYSNALALE